MKKLNSRILAPIIVALVYFPTLLYCAYYNASNPCETANIVAGVTILKHGRFDLYQVNPPLYKIVSAAPLMLFDVSLDEKVYYEHTTRHTPGARPEFTMATEFAKRNRERLRLYLFLARVACLSFALVGAYFSWRWSRELFGERAGLVALVLWSFCPNVMTWSAFALPDASSAALGVMFGYYFWRWVKEPSWRDVCWLGGCLGAVWLTKFTWILLVPLLPAMWLASFALGTTRTRRAFISQCAQLFVVMVIGAFVVNLGYGFEGSLKPLGEYKFCSRTLSGDKDALADYDYEKTKASYKGGNRFKGTALESIPVPVPENYLVGIDLQKVDFERGMPSYFNGEWSDRGWKLFYWECAALKIPLGGLALFLAACCFAFRHAHDGGDRRSALRDALCVLAPGVTLFVFVSLQSGFSRHFRYVLPALPFFYIFASSVFAESRLPSRILRRALAYGCLAWFVASALSVYPHTMSYFNELAGGSRNGWRYFLDANFDWGQETYALQDWLERRGRKDVMVKLRDDFAENSSFIVNYPQIPILVDQIPEDMTSLLTEEAQLDLRLRGPRPGTYAISVEALNDRYGRYRYLQDLEPIERIGYAVNIYELNWDECQRLRAKYQLPPITRPEEDGATFLREFCQRGRHARPIHAAFLYFSNYDVKPLQEFQHILADDDLNVVERITPQQVREGELDQFDVIIVPGGQASEQTQALGALGANAIRRFVENGGGYFGVCAGAYLTTMNEEYKLRLINLRARTDANYVPGVGITPIYMRDAGRVDLSLTAEGEEFFTDELARKLSDVFYFTGPFFQQGYQSDLPEPIALARFDTEVADYEFQRGTMLGAIAIAAAPFGKGTVVVTSPHLEYDAKFNPYLRALLQGAAREQRSNEVE